MHDTRRGRRRLNIDRMIRANQARLTLPGSKGVWTPEEVAEINRAAHELVIALAPYID